jgi:hypothetical protein
MFPLTSPAMPAPDLDSIRHGVLARMERSDRLVKWSIIGAALLEAVLLVAILLLVDRRDPLHRLLLVLFLLNYMVMVLGLVAIAGHVSRSADRVVAALESLASR